MSRFVCPVMLLSIKCVASSGKSSVSMSGFEFRLPHLVSLSLVGKHVAPALYGTDKRFSSVKCPISYRANHYLYV